MTRKSAYDDTISVSVGGAIVLFMIVVFVSYLVGDSSFLGLKLYMLLLGVSIRAS